MKKLLLWTVSLTLMLSLCACGGDKPADDTDSAATTTTRTPDFTYDDDNVFNDAELNWG